MYTNGDAMEFQSTIHPGLLGEPIPETDLDQGAKFPPAQEALALEAANILLAQTGDSEAWTYLDGLHRPHIFGFFRHRLSSPEDAEELTQDTLFRAYKKLDTFSNEGCGLRPWLFAIARKHLTSRYIQLQATTTRIGHIVSLNSLRDNDEAVSTMYGPEEEALAHLNLINALKQLIGHNPRWFDIIVERGFYGKEQEETATSLGIPMGTVQSGYYRALAFIRSQLHAR